jgi:hypothetical protein
MTLETIRRLEDRFQEWETTEPFGEVENAIDFDKELNILGELAEEKYGLLQRFSRLVYAESSPVNNGMMRVPVEILKSTDLVPGSIQNLFGLDDAHRTGNEKLSAEVDKEPDKRNTMGMKIAMKRADSSIGASLKASVFCRTRPAWSKRREFSFYPTRCSDKVFKLGRDEALKSLKWTVDLKASNEVNGLNMLKRQGEVFQDVFDFMVMVFDRRLSGLDIATS